MRLLDSTDDELTPHSSVQDLSVYTTSTIMSVRSFKDCVHDYMPFGPAICAIIDTPQFQRLRNIKQLGTSYYVWPGASHNRFEHSLGVAHLARLMVEHLRTSQPELGITLREIKCVTIAGLCHDLGHGPFSHVWDGTFIPQALPNEKWTHEQASEMMFDSLIEENELEIDERDVTFIKALIAGDPSRCKDHPEKPFLFQIVANKANGLDVDKFDYFARDTHAIEQKALSVTSRLISSARVINNEITYNIKDATQVYEVYHTRFTLHKSIYNHKTAKGIEYMIVDALLAAEHRLQIARRIFDPKSFLHLTDDILQRIESSEDPELAEARAILLRVKKRDLYRAVDYKVYPWSYKEYCKAYFTPQKIVQAAKKLYSKPEPEPAHLQSSTDDSTVQEVDELKIGHAAELVDEGPELSPEAREVDPEDLEALNANHVIVDLVSRHHGMEEKNPLDFVKFYSKQRPNVAEPATAEVVSLALPKVFGEVFLRIYTRDSRFFGLVQAGFRELQRTMNWEDDDIDLDHDSEGETVSPKLSQATSGKTAVSSSSGHPPLTPPNIEEPPSMPPQKHRTLVRAASIGEAKLRQSGTGRNALLKPNPYTTVDPSWKRNESAPQLRLSNSPTRDGGAKKRDRSVDSASRAAAKKGRRYAE